MTFPITSPLKKLKSSNRIIAYTSQACIRIEESTQKPHKYSQNHLTVVCEGLINTILPPHSSSSPPLKKRKILHLHSLHQVCNKYMLLKYCATCHGKDHPIIKQKQDNTPEYITC